MDYTNFIIGKYIFNGFESKKTIYELEFIHAKRGYRRTSDHGYFKVRQNYTGQLTPI